MNGKQIIAMVLTSAFSGCSPQPPLSNLPLQERLNELKERSAPKFETVMAMCYAIMDTPKRENYHCPICGKKTTYIEKESPKQVIPPHEREMDYSWDAPVRNVEAMREKMKELAPLAQQNGYQFRLDESGLCASCGKNKKADFALIAIDEAGKKTTTEGFNEYDVIYLTSFFKGMNYYTLRPRDNFPLKEKADRIAQLLGLNPNSSEKKD